MTGLVLGVVIALLALSALVSAAGAAAYQIGESRLRTLQEEGFRGADALAKVREDGERGAEALHLLSGGLDLAAVGIATMASGLAWGSLPALGTLLAGIAVVLLVSDVLPQVFAARHPVRIALAAAPVLASATRWLRWIVAPLERIEEAFVPEDRRETSLGEREFREIQQLGQAEGVLEEHETLLVERAFRLDELTVWDVMTPRVDMFAWKDSLTLDDIVGDLANVPFSRVPVYGDSVDDVTGVLHVREAYEAYVAGQRGRVIGSLARAPFFVPGSLSLSRALRSFQAERIHMGIVADEFGGIDGLVTLEDVVEELVGEIVDETDLAEEAIERISGTEALADAGVDVRDINVRLNVSLPILEHRSLNGFILEELGYVPRVGEVLERSGVRIEVVEASETQVLRARVTRLAAPEDAASAGTS